MATEKTSAKKAKQKPKDSQLADKKVFDFVHPDKAMPSASAKPIIVTHRAVIKDPMVSGVPESAVASPGNKTAPAEKKIEKTAPTIGEMAARAQSKTAGTTEEPLKEKLEEPTVTPPEPTEKPAESPTAEPKSEKPEVLPAETSSAPDDKLEEDKDGEKDDIQELADDTGDTKTTEKDTPGKSATKPLENKTDQVIEAMIESKQYFVPINTVKKRRSKQVLAAVLLLAALGGAGAAYYILYMK